MSEFKGIEGEEFEHVANDLLNRPTDVRPTIEQVLRYIRALVGNNNEPFSRYTVHQQRMLSESQTGFYDALRRVVPRSDQNYYRAGFDFGVRLVENLEWTHLLELDGEENPPV